MIRLVVETLVVLALGVVLGLGFNAVSDQGLDLGRDYFPKGPVVVSQAAAPPADTTPGTEPAEEVEAAEPATAAQQTDTPDAGLDPHLVERLASKGLVGIGFDEAVEVWESELRLRGAILFVDARNDDDYQEGHIPGAWQLDHYRPDRNLGELLPMLPGTMQIVVYCTGGDCEDSESAALLLQQFGADASTMQVYVGGITEWREKGMSVEVGPRDSGELIEGSDG